MNYSINIKKITNYMQDNNLSKTKFCKMCKISPLTLQRLLKNDLLLSCMVLLKVALVMKCSTDDLIIYYD